MKTGILVICTALLGPLSAVASTTIPTLENSQYTTTTDSDWRVSASMYGWLTRLDGDISFRAVTVPVDVPFRDIFDNLKFAFSGAAEVGHGKWSFMSDLFYAKLEPSTTIGRTAFNSQIEQFVGNFAVFYNVVDTDCTRVDTFVGARVNWMETDVSIIRPRRTRNLSADDTWVDPVIGMRIHRDLNDKFFLRGLADIDGFGIASDITWQAMAIIGYHASENTSIGIGYRGIGTDYSSGNSTYDMISHGVILGLEYKF